MLLNFSDLEIEEKLNIYQNGADVVKFFQWVIMDPEVDDEIQPVSLLLLDINMPIMHGLECSEKINQMYKEQNQERLKQNKPPLVSPLTCFMTQTPYYMLKSLIKQEEMTDVYLEKPMKNEEIQNLLKILNISKSGKPKVST